MTTPLPDFAVLLRRLRRARRLSQEDLAGRAGLSVSAISYLERGLTQTPQADTVHLLAEALALGAQEDASLRRAARGPRDRTSDGAEVSTSPPVDSLDSWLPEPLTSLIGRRDEVEEVARLLAQERVRLVTLTGPAGVGKTRLALEAAAAVRSEHVCDVVFVDLIPIQEPERVVPAIAQALGVREQGGRPVTYELRAALAERRLLLILDNFEQVLPAARGIANLLGSCRHVKVLVTSREALHVRGEIERAVHPLDVPSLDEPPGEGIEHVAAVALFLERARAVRPEFALVTAEQAQIVATICARLDGLPLAIELAAARVRSLSLRELRDRLLGEAPLSVLAGGARDLADHQQAMRATIEWSYRLLRPEEQWLFRVLGVFVGGATVDAIEAISEMASEDVQDGLSSLAVKHLVGWSEREGLMCYTQLVTLRAYAVERLIEHGEDAAARTRHARFYLDLLLPFRTMLWGSEQLAVLDRFELELDNVRSAIRWTHEREEIDLGLRLATAAWLCCHMRGHLSEGRAWFDLFLARARLAESVFDPMLLADALSGAGTLAYDQGELEHAAALVAESLEICLRIGYIDGAGASANNLALIAEAQGDYTRARILHEQNFARARQREDKGAMANSLVNLASVAAQQGMRSEAVSHYEASLTLYRHIGDVDSGAEALNGLAELALHDDDDERAWQLADESLISWRALGNTPQIAFALAQLGELYRRAGDLDGAAARLREALELSRATGRMSAVLRSLEGCALLCLDRGHAERAAQLHGAVAALRDSLKTPVPPLQRRAFEHSLGVIRAALGEVDFARAFADGQSLSLNDAMALAAREWL